MFIDYYYDMTPMGSLSIADIGNCYIEASTDIGLRFYFAARTKFGITKMFIFGPVYSDGQEIVKQLRFEIKKIDYSPKKIKEALNKLLNANKYPITQARYIEKDEFEAALPDLLKLFQMGDMEVDDD